MIWNKNSNFKSEQSKYVSTSVRSCMMMMTQDRDSCTENRKLSLPLNKVLEIQI